MSNAAGYFADYLASLTGAERAEVAAQIAAFTTEGAGAGLEVLNTGTLISDFEDLTLWTVGGTGAAKSADTVNKQAGVQSLKLTTGSSGPNVVADFVCNLAIDSSTVFLLWVNIDDPNPITSFTLYLYETAGAFVRFYTAQAFPSGSVGGKKCYAFSAADLTANGGITLPTTIHQARLRFDAAFTASMSFDSFYANRKVTKPKFCVTFDDELASQYTEAFAYMQAKSLLGTIYNISGSVGGSSMSLAQLQEVYAANWDIGTHTNTHVHINQKSAASVCASQTPAPAMTINGSSASGGVATFDTSRHVVFNTTGNQAGKYATITGTLAGQAVTETVYLLNNLAAVSRSLFDTVTAISCTVTTAMTVGTSYSYAEIYAELQASRDYLLNNGMPRAALHHAYPYGETNESV